MPGVPEHGGGQALPWGLGAQPPAVGAEGGAGRAGGSNTSPPWGDCYLLHLCGKVALLMPVAGQQNRIP